MRIFLSELAENKLLKLSQYLLENWNKKTRDKFIEKLKGKIEQVSLLPKAVLNQQNLTDYINVL